MVRKSRMTIAALAVAALVPALAACGAGGQSKADACATVEEGLNTVTADINAALTQAMSGEDGVAALEEMNSQIASLGDEITNEEVKTAYDDFAVKFEALSAEVSALTAADQTDVDALQEASTNIQTQATELTTSAQNVDTVCSS